MIYYELFYIAKILHQNW